MPMWYPTSSAGAFPEANVGDTLKGTTSGPLDWNQFGGTYAVQATAPGAAPTRGSAWRPPTRTRWPPRSRTPRPARRCW